MIMLLTFPTSYMALAWRQMRVPASPLVATQYVNGLMPHYTIFNEEMYTFAKMANIHMGFVYDMCVGSTRAPSTHSVGM